MRRDPENFEFTRRLLELVAGTDDAFASALGFREVAQDVPTSMPARDRLAVRAGGAASLGLPWAVMPVARRWLRDRVASLVLAAKLPATAAAAAKPGPLADGLRGYSERGLVPVVRPLGDPVHGPNGAALEVERLTALASIPTLGHLVVDPARIAPSGSDWSAADDVAIAAERLRPILEASVAHGTVVLLEPRDVRWSRLLPAVLTQALGDPVLDRAWVGVRLFAELPESRQIYDHISRWAQRRVAEGGAPAEVVIGVGGVAGRERILSIESGLAVPVLEDRVEVTANLLRLAELALHPGRAAFLRPVVETEDLHVLGAVAGIAEREGSGALASVQVRAGVAPGLAEVLAGSFSEVRVALPVVPPREFAGAVDTLVGIAAEAADPESPIARLETLLTPVQPAAADADEEELRADGDPEALGRRALAAADTEFAGAAALAAEDAPVSHRTQLRSREWDPTARDSALFYRAPDEPSQFDTGGLTAAVLGLIRGDTGEFQLEAISAPVPIPVVSASGFANEPQTDASLAGNRDWVRGVLARAAEEAGERDEVNQTVALSEADLDPAVAASEARETGERWGALPDATRASRLRRAALAVVAARDRLLQALALDTGAPAAELDAEVDDVVDAARYAGQLAEALSSVRGATFVPDTLALVAADERTPLSTQAEAVLAMLAAGSGVLWSVPQRTFAAAQVLLEEWGIAGISAGAVRLEAIVVGRTLAEIAASPGVDRAVVLGDRAAALELARRRPDLRVEGRFRALGSILVTPSADLDAAVSDVVESALRGAGSDPRGAQVAILLGSVGRSKRFREGLADAVRAIRVGDTARPDGQDPLGFDLGPLAAAPDAAGLRALTELGRGEEWLVEPQRLDEEGRLWRPGVRLGVGANSTFWEDARGVPVIGIAHAHTLGEAISLQNAGGGGAAGIQSYDESEILTWVDGVRASFLAINRPTTSARIERHPGGGWGEAGMGLPALAGGPNRLIPLGSWRTRSGTRSETLHLRGLTPEVQLLIEAAQPDLDYEDFDQVRRAALADALSWRTTFSIVTDGIGLGIERNAVRYLPVPTHIRLAEGGSVAELVRVLAAALLVHAPITISTGELLPESVSDFLERQGIEVSLERDDDWVERLAVSGPLGADGERADRVRLIGGDAVRTAEWMGGLDRTALWSEPVTMAGPVELLTLLREQAISARAHRHGLATPAPGLDELIGE
ncbi:aldehyde dehydrogenase family protein [Leucobacter sp. CSA2]|uniref:Aldehyde dehydrogenase family protein n=2 Tax=Leucobacter edaphi TaxID=2796472 RepID=A0A934QE49_9MICO|nr:aldehyde dehydrogenase family protein [Leucobacter edaphi]